MSDTSSRLPGRAFREEMVPIAAKVVRGATPTGIWGAAVYMHNIIVDPTTGKPWHGKELDVMAPSAFQQGTAEFVSVAVKESEAEDATAHDHAERARQHVDQAVDRIEHTATILDDLYDGPNGSPVTGLDLIVQYQADQVVAGQREAEGDTRHLDRRFEHGWVVIAAGVLAILDLILLWRPLLGLGYGFNSDSVVKWVVGGALAAAQALFIESVLRYYRRVERASCDRRSALTDYNRSVGLKAARGDLSASVDPQPNPEDLVSADQRLSIAERLVIGAATMTGVVCGVRVAILGRESGFSVVESAVFASIIGVVIGALVILLAWLAQRGNQLGDRLRRGEESVARVEAEVQQARAAVADLREQAWSELSQSQTLSTAAAQTRDEIADSYWAAMSLTCSWVGFDSDKIPRPDSQLCRVSILTLTTKLRASTENRLHGIDAWLAQRSTVRRPVAAAMAAISAVTPAATTAVVPVSTAPPSANQVVVIKPGVPVPAEPKRAAGLVAIGAAVTVAAAVAAAMFAPPPEGRDGAPQQAVGHTQPFQQGPTVT